MQPDVTYAVARFHQHDLNRHAEVGRRAAEFKTPKHRRVEVRAPRFEFAYRIAAIRRAANA
jgi:hypothetical protein